MGHLLFFCPFSVEIQSPALRSHMPLFIYFYLNSQFNQTSNIARFSAIYSGGGRVLVFVFPPDSYCNRDFWHLLCNFVVIRRRLWCFSRCSFSFAGFPSFDVMLSWLDGCRDHLMFQGASASTS
jgi:hypothetical protein